MDKDIVLNVKDIHLKYKFYKTQKLKQTLLRRDKRKITEFEALKGISFEVERGINMGSLLGLARILEL